MKKAFLFAALAALLLLPVLKMDKQDGSRSTAVSGSFMEDVRVVRKEGGKTLWSLSSVRTNISPDGTTAGMRSVTVDLPERGLTVTADSGSYNLENSDLSLEGGVKARAADYTLSTGSVRLASGTGEIATAGEVVIQGRRFTIQGKGLRAYDGKIMLLADVKAELY